MTPLRALLHESFSGLFDLFYPNLCQACGRHLPAIEQFLCPACLYQLPHTRYHLLVENPFTERFWGRVPLCFGAAQFFFTTGGRVQRLIHLLKYHHRPDIGRKLGQLYAAELREAEHFPKPHAIIPVPLHPRKLQQRGYNQSAAFAQGLADGLKVPMYEHGLRRLLHTESQTRKSRIERVANVGNAFGLGHLKDLPPEPHFLLVDDVLTTGATLEACAQPLLALPGARVSMATIAIADG